VRDAEIDRRGVNRCVEMADEWIEMFAKWLGIE